MLGTELEVRQFYENMVAHGLEVPFCSATCCRQQATPASQASVAPVASQAPPAYEAPLADQTSEVPPNGTVSTPVVPATAVSTALLPALVTAQSQPPPNVPAPVATTLVVNYLVLSLFAYLEFKEQSWWLVLFDWVALAVVSILLIKRWKDC